MIKWWHLHPKGQRSTSLWHHNVWEKPFSCRYSTQEQKGRQGPYFTASDLLTLILKLCRLFRRCADIRYKKSSILKVGRECSLCSCPASSSSSSSLLPLVCLFYSINILKQKLTEYDKFVKNRHRVTCCFTVWTTLLSTLQWRFCSTCLMKPLSIMSRVFFISSNPWLRQEALFDQRHSVASGWCSAEVQFRGKRSGFTWDGCETLWKWLTGDCVGTGIWM